MRLLVARCAVEYQGRLGARLGRRTRLILFKADGSIAIHSDAKAYKPLNWMNPPCTIEGDDGVITARTPKGETLRIELLEVLHDIDASTLGVDPGLEKDGVEAELQELLAARVAALRDRHGADPARVSHRHRPGRPPVPATTTAARSSSR